MMGLRVPFFLSLLSQLIIPVSTPIPFLTCFRRSISIDAFHGAGLKKGGQVGLVTVKLDMWLVQWEKHNLVSQQLKTL